MFKNYFSNEDDVKRTENIDGCVYIFFTDYSFYKVGYSTNIGKRISQVDTNCPFPLTKFLMFKSPRANVIERCIHIRFRKHKTSGEWFKLTLGQLDWMIRIIEKYRLLNRKEMTGIYRSLFESLKKTP